MTLRLVVAVALAVALLAAAASSARAGAQVDAAVEALRSAPIYVADDAQMRLDNADRSRIERAIARDQPGPLYVAVLPDSARAEAGGDTGELVRQIALTLRRPGTYVVLAGRQLRAASTLLPRGEAGRLASAALDAHRDEGAAAVIADLVHRVAEARQGAGDGGGDGGSGGFSALWLLGLLAVGGGAFAFVRSRRRRRELEAQMADLRRVARDDLVSLGDEVRAVDLDVEMPGEAAAAAREELTKALACYEEAERRFTAARTPDDFGPVTSACEEGRYWMAAVRARLAGQEPPERRPPCFFDPRHGPSTRDVEWSPDGGTPRMVPACEADAQRVEAGGDPMAREIVLGGRSMPYWNAPPYFGPWAGGYFGGFGFGAVGGFLPGLLFGSMLGGGLGGGLLGAPLEWGAGYDDGGDGGDFGGGDFGGGDFGGGDFGGGDFGGGDFGGGDF